MADDGRIGTGVGCERGARAGERCGGECSAAPEGSWEIVSDVQSGLAVMAYKETRKIGSLAYRHAKTVGR